MNTRHEYLYTQAVQALVYGWPLYEMQRMRSATSPRKLAGHGFAGESPDSSLRWCNAFVHERELLTAGRSRVVMPNNDTLYTNAWLDLSAGPLVLDMPDMGARYHVLGMLDFFTNPFGHPGTRTLGNGGGAVLVTPPGWQGSVPEAFQAPGRHIEAPTPWVWVIGRLLIDGAHELDQVHALQDGFGIRSLADWQAGRPGAPRRFDARHDPRAPFAPQRFLAMANDALRENPPPAGDSALLTGLRAVGLGADDATVAQMWADPAMVEVWRRAADTVQALLDHRADALGQHTPATGWSRSMMSLTGGFGHDHLLRAFVARQGIGALSPHEAIYPRCETDSTGRMLDGAQRYRLRFAPGQLPPVNAFWSITLYSTRDFMLVDNPIARYAIGDRTPGLQHDADGGLTLHIQHAPPLDDAARANWLPAPADGFFLCLRAYLPRAEMLDGRYVLPAPEPVGD